MADNIHGTYSSSKLQSYMVLSSITNNIHYSFLTLDSKVVRGLYGLKQHNKQHPFLFLFLYSLFSLMKVDVTVSKNILTLIVL